MVFVCVVVGMILLGSMASSAIDLAIVGFRMRRASSARDELDKMNDGLAPVVASRYEKLMNEIGAAA